MHIMLRNMLLPGSLAVIVGQFRVQTFLHFTDVPTTSLTNMRSSTFAFTRGDVRLTRAMYACL